MKCELFVKGSTSHCFEIKMCILRRKTDFKDHNREMKVRIQREEVTEAEFWDHHHNSFSQ